jgi:hypothetical protein
MVHLSSAKVQIRRRRVACCSSKQYNERDNNTGWATGGLGVRLAGHVSTYAMSSMQQKAGLEVTLRYSACTMRVASPRACECMCVCVCGLPEPRSRRGGCEVKMIGYPAARC